MTSSVGKLLISLHLPADTVRAQRWLRVNNKIVIYNNETAALVAGDLSAADGKFDPSRYTRPENGFYVNSLCVERLPDGTYRLTSDTILDGETEKNFSCIVRGNGRLVTGTVNTFAFGEMPIDQGYVTELLEESLDAKHQWDVIERAEAVEPVKGEPPAAAAAAAAAAAPEKAKAEKKEEVGEKPKKNKKRTEAGGSAPADKEVKKLRSKKKVQSELKPEE